MKYLRRALKYFIRMAFLVVVIIGVLMAAGLVSSDINIAFRDGWRSVGMIAAILGGISLPVSYTHLTLPRRHLPPLPVFRLCLPRPCRRG